MLPRSFLYVPGNRPDLFDKAAGGQADAVVLDLEDAVPLPAKAEAREAVRRWLDARDSTLGAQAWVRVDPAALTADLDAVLHPHLDGLFLATATPTALDALTTHPAWQDESRWLRSERQRASRNHDPSGQPVVEERAPASDRPVVEERAPASVSKPPTPAVIEERAPASVSKPPSVVALIESAQGLQTLQQMSTHPALTAFGIGEVDLLGDLRVTRTHRTEAVILALRTQVVVASAAAGLEAPVAPTSTDFRDLDAFGESTRLALDLGFRSRTAIHPAQVPVIHDALAPTADEVAAAQDVVGRYEASGSSVALDSAGRLIDGAVVRGARETLARAGT
ncbi:aldolase/citrate lyase family protein [Nocardioides sp. P86]|uniref:HpcH/HpaI aldolase/citrate lyase family protein n=1 Tax=Nocardioides sp. P86 TaxID=2939569 RepID=UPI00203B34C3|nr:aldolase/citrate lyase family protein [Nocardioides sp. P86]MCM3515072.1 aldolase/citrate lyase family protein [Nocardioides sp. P86]